MWSVNGGIGSVECEWWSREGGVWSVNGGVGRVECEWWKVGRESMECE